MEETITEDILGSLSQVKFGKDSVVISGDEASPGIFLIQKGHTKVHRLNSNGKELILHHFKEGDCFGERSALDGAPQTDWVTAASDLTLYFLPKERLHQILQKHPKLYPSVLRSICKWMDHLNVVIDSISLSSARERVAAFLKRLVIEQDSEIIRLPYKKHEVAMMLGLRPETFSRVLSEIESIGAIKLSHRQIQVIDETLL